MNSSDKAQDEISGAGFTAAELRALRRWEVPEFKIPSGNERKRALPSPPPPPPKTAAAGDPPQKATPRLTVEQIEAVQKQAYDEAFAQGKKEGYAQGYHEGFQEGFQQGREEGQQQGYAEKVGLLQQRAQIFDSLMQTLTQPLQQLDARVEHALVKLALGVAAQLVRRELKAAPDQVVAVIREAVAALPLAAQHVQLHLHPEDAALVRQLLDLDQRNLDWEILEDPLMTRGGCLVNTDVSRIDATVENRLAAVIANVLGGEREADHAG